MSQPANWARFISPFKLTILAVNLICFGACIVLLVLGRPLILLLIGTGLYSAGGLIGAIMGARNARLGKIEAGKKA